MLRTPLTPTTALGGAAPSVDTAGAYRLEERPDVAIASVSARASGREAAAEVWSGLIGAAPGAGQRVAGANLEAFWVGPDQWFALADLAARELLASELKAAFGDAASVTEQNDGWACFELSGEGLDAVLERLANVDLGAFEAGGAVRTVVDHIGCFLIVDAPGARCRFLCPRSFAASFRHATVTAMRSAAALGALRAAAP